MADPEKPDDENPESDPAFVDAAPFPVTLLATSTPVSEFHQWATAAVKAEATRAHDELAIPGKKLGKKPARHTDPRLLRLASVFKAPVAQDFDWSTRLVAASSGPKFGMMANDGAGCCTASAIGHLIQVWTACNGGEITVSDEDVLDLYKRVTLKVNGVAYDPDDPSTDTGCALVDVLKEVRANGIGPQQHCKGIVYGLVNHHDIDELRAAGRAFGGLYTGVMLPISAQAQIGKTWTPTRGPDGEPDSWGGHCVPLIAASASGNGGVKYITWGEDQYADMPWVHEYADEMFAIIAPEWVDGTKPAPSGLDMVALRAYLTAL